MYKLLFRWAFNDFLLLRLLAYMIAASSKTKLGALRGRPQSSYVPVFLCQKGSLFVKTLTGAGFQAILFNYVQSIIPIPYFNWSIPSEKAEKRHFKLYIKRSSAKEDLKIVQLFDALDKLPEYDEKLLLKRLPGIEKPQLSNLKTHLYKQVLASLRLLKSSGKHRHAAARAAWIMPVFYIIRACTCKA